MAEGESISLQEARELSLRILRDGEARLRVERAAEAAELFPAPECHAECCPVCTGHGRAPGNELEMRPGTTAVTGLTCSTCHGKGYILIPNKLPEGE